MNPESNFEKNQPDTPDDERGLDISGIEEASDFENEPFDFENAEALPVTEGEQPEEYLERVNELFVSDIERKDGNAMLVKGLNAAGYPEYANFYQKSLAYLNEVQGTAEFQRGLDAKFDDEKNAFVLESVKMSYKYSENYGKTREDGHTTFEHTNQSRKFFGQARGFDNVPYMQTLFEVGTVTPESVTYLQGKIAGKRVLMLGGGHSAEDLIEKEIMPEIMINADPYLHQERAEKGSKYPYVSIPVKAEDPDMVRQELGRIGAPKVDEIWASFSVPYYLSTPEEIEGMFETITETLDEGGVARIFPISSREDGQDGECYDEFVKQVKVLLDSPQFNAYTANTHNGTTLFIRKLRPDSAGRDS